VKVNAIRAEFSFVYEMQEAAVFTRDGKQVEVGRLLLINDHGDVDASELIAFNGGGKASDARFKKNPVILFAHDNRSLPIGKAPNTEVRDGQLETEIQFASAAACPMAEHVWQSIQEETLRAVSVGFRPKTIRKERHDDKDVFVLADNELYEISVVPIPSNPDAVARMKAALSPPKVEQEQSAIGGEEKNMEIEEKCA